MQIHFLFSWSSHGESMDRFAWAFLNDCSPAAYLERESLLSSGEDAVQIGQQGSDALLAIHDVQFAIRLLMYPHLMQQYYTSHSRLLYAPALLRIFRNLRTSWCSGLQEVARNGHIFSDLQHPMVDWKALRLAFSRGNGIFSPLEQAGLGGLFPQGESLL